MSSRQQLVPAKPPAVAALPGTAGAGTVVSFNGIAHVYNHGQWWEIVPIVVSETAPENVPPNTIWIGPELEGATPQESATPSDGREIELQTNATHIQWRYVGDPTWTDLVAFSELVGESATPESATPDEPIDLSGLLLTGYGAPLELEGQPDQHYIDLDSQQIFRKAFESDIPPVELGSFPHPDNAGSSGLTTAVRLRATSVLNVAKIGGAIRSGEYSDATEVRYLLLDNNDEIFDSNTVNIIGQTPWVDIRTATNDPLEPFEIDLLSPVEIAPDQNFWIAIQSRDIATGDPVSLMKSYGGPITGNALNPGGNVFRQWNDLTFDEQTVDMTVYYASFRLGMAGTYTWSETPVLDLKSDVMGVVVHGSDNSVARPTGFASVTWIGSVEPLNMTVDDVWDPPEPATPEAATPDEVDISAHEGDTEDPHAAAGYIKGNFERLIASLDPPATPSHGDVWIRLPAEDATPNESATPSEIDASVPIGGIIMYSGNVMSLPAEWALCDGTNGTPDLRGMFIVGAGGAYTQGDTGGSETVTLTTAQMPVHTHTGPSHSHSVGSLTTNSTGSHSHALPYRTNDAVDHNHKGSTSSVAQGGTGAGENWSTTLTDINTLAEGSHSHTISGSTAAAGTGVTGSTGSGEAHENRPPYYALAYIMRVDPLAGGGGGGSLGPLGTDFSEYTVGETPSGWQIIEGAGSATIEEKDGANALKLSSGDKVVVWSDLGEYDGDVEVLVKMQHGDAAANNNYCGPVSRYDPDNVSFSNIQFAGSYLRQNSAVRIYRDGSYTETSSALPETVGADTDFFLRFRYEVSTSTQRARLWLASSEEPVDWDLELTGAIMTPTAGLLGVAVFGTASTDYYCKLFSVAVEGETAPGA